MPRFAALVILCASTLAQADTSALNHRIGRAPVPAELRPLIGESADASLPAAERLGDLQRAFFAPGNDPSSWLTGWYPAVQKMENAAAGRTPQDEFIRAGTVSILDIQAADDTLVPHQNSRDLQNELGSRVTIAVIDHAGHALPVERPPEVAQAITAYLAEQNH